MLNVLSLLLFGFLINFQFIWSVKPEKRSFIGDGYDLARGNPKTNGTDSGFRESLFQFTFDNNLNTKADEYTLPDDVVSNKLNFCSFSTITNQYNGTKLYQEQLKDLVSVGSSSLIVQRAFTASEEYKLIENTVKKNGKVVIETGSKCEVYSIEIPDKNVFQLNSIFKVRAVLAYSGIYDWKKLIEMFGTHYVKYIELGSRVYLQHIFNQEDYLDLKSKKFDTNEIAKQRFLSWTGGFDLKLSEDVINTFQSKLNETRHIYIGGIPTQADDLNIWQQAAIKQPAPLKFKLNSLADLFTRTNFMGLSHDELVGMKEQFNQAVYTYCLEMNCSEPDVDDIVVTSRTDSFGGDSLNSVEFSDEVPRSSTATIKKVFMRFDTVLHSIQFLVADSKREYLSELRGGTKLAQLYSWAVPNGEYINQIDICFTDDKVNSIRFYTDKGNAWPRVFGCLEDEQLQRIKLKGQLIGVFGRESNEEDKIIEKIGFISNEIIKV